MAAATASKPQPQPQAGSETQANSIHAYRMPTASVGDTVLWHPEASRTCGASIATVLFVNANSLDLEVRGRDGASRSFGVHHMDDPILPTSKQVRAVGGWDYPPETKRLDALEARIKALEDQLS